MRAHQIYLELTNLFCGDADAGKFAKAGVDAVGGLTRSYQAIDDAAGCVHAFGCDSRKRNFFTVQSDRVELIKGEVVPVQLNRC